MCKACFFSATKRKERVGEEEGRDPEAGILVWSGEKKNNNVLQVLVCELDLQKFRKPRQGPGMGGCYAEGRGAWQVGGPVAPLSSGLADPGSAIFLHAPVLGELLLTHGGTCLVLGMRRSVGNCGGHAIQLTEDKRDRPEG